MTPTHTHNPGFVFVPLAQRACSFARVALQNAQHAMTLAETATCAADVAAASAACDHAFTMAGLTFNMANMSAEANAFQNAFVASNVAFMARCEVRAAARRFVAPNPLVWC